MKSSAEDLMKDILLSEIIAGDIRAKRSLRVVEDQERQITGLQDELSQKSNLLEELKEQHTELLQVRDYMQEVQELQRQLIKLQEIEYLSHVTTPDVVTSSQGQLTSSDSSKSMCPPPQDSDVKLSRSRLLRENVIAGTFKSKLGILGSGTNFENDIADDMHLSFGNETTPNMDVDRISSKNRMTVSTQMASSKREDDNDDDDIRVLRKALSSHKESISSLSREVLVLRAERDELMSYMQNFVQPSTTKMEASFDLFGDAEKKDSLATLGRDDEWLTTSKNEELEYCTDDVEVMSRDREFVTSRKPSNLEIRADRLWETACKFFTPAQAHYILTTPIPTNEDYYDDENE